MAVGPVGVCQMQSMRYSNSRFTEGDIRTAAELLQVMERVSERARAKLRYENRHAAPLIELARRELQMKMARKRS